jgi:hypothetical protein
MVHGSACTATSPKLSVTARADLTGAWWRKAEHRQEGMGGSGFADVYLGTQCYSRSEIHRRRRTTG